MLLNRRSLSFIDPKVRDLFRESWLYQSMTPFDQEEYLPRIGQPVFRRLRLRFFSNFYSWNVYELIIMIVLEIEIKMGAATGQNEQGMYPPVYEMRGHGMGVMCKLDRESLKEAVGKMVFTFRKKDVSLVEINVYN